VSFTSLTPFVHEPFPYSAYCLPRPDFTALCCQLDSLPYKGRNRTYLEQAQGPEEYVCSLLVSCVASTTSRSFARLLLQPLANMAFYLVQQWWVVAGPEESPAVMGDANRVHGQQVGDRGAGSSQDRLEFGAAPSSLGTIALNGSSALSA
jgi:hypothetical protein